MSSQQTRQTGWVLRIYKNADNKVLAIDDIAVVTDTRRITSTRFHHSSRWTSKRMLIYLGIGDRIIDKIQVLGSKSADGARIVWIKCPEDAREILESFLGEKVLMWTVSLETFYLAITEHSSKEINSSEQMQLKEIE